MSKADLVDKDKVQCVLEQNQKCCGVIINHLVVLPRKAVVCLKSPLKHKGIWGFCAPLRLLTDIWKYLQGFPGLRNMAQKLVQRRRCFFLHLLVKICKHNKNALLISYEYLYWIQSEHLSPVVHLTAKSNNTLNSS